MTIGSPPSRIYLLRHARSGWAAPGERDFDRRLDDHGYAEAEHVATRAAERGYSPGIVVSSTAMRCRETAEAIRRNLSETLEIAFVDSLYNGTLETYLTILDSQRGFGSVMLVGHNPTMEELLEAMIGAEAMIAAIPGGFPTAGLAVLDPRSPAGAGHAWQLADFITV